MDAGHTSLPAQPAINRRRFLRQSFLFSAAAMAGQLAGGGAPPPPASEAANLLMIGDWGAEDPEAGQRRVAEAMGRYAREQAVHAQALLLLGDNWYGELAGGPAAPRWQSQFEAMYPASVFPAPAYAVLGNHDYQRWPNSKVEDEMAYARTGKTRFTLPARWYSFAFPAHDPLITFIALDSNTPKSGGKFELGRDFTLTPAEYAQQLAWFEAELRKPRTTPHLVVMAHHPVYSDGPHGDHPTLIRDWDPLLRKYNVGLYLAGHDHDLQHLEFAGHPTSFWLSGGGGADLYNLKIQPSERGPFAKKVFGFSHLSATRTELTLRHVDDGGRVVHSFSKGANGAVSLHG